MAEVMTPQAKLKTALRQPMIVILLLKIATPIPTAETRTQIAELRTLIRMQILKTQMRKRIAKQAQALTILKPILMQMLRLIIREVVHLMLEEVHTMELTRNMPMKKHKKNMMNNFKISNLVLRKNVTN